MKLDEMIALAKAGYKKKDIDAIIESEKATSRDADNSKADESTAEEKPAVETPAEDIKEAPTEEDITTEALKDAYAEIESLKKDLAKAQSANVNKEVTETGENEDIKTVEDMVRSFM